MITFTQGNLLEARVDALVNTVNTVGVMGKGIALMFKERFAENYRRYAVACKAKEVSIGRMFVTEVNELDGHWWIVNFPTKQHWRGDSRLEWIAEGLLDLRRFLVEHKVKSVAVPPLGAGNGGLDWAEVRARIEAVLGDLDTRDTRVRTNAEVSERRQARRCREADRGSCADSRAGAPLLGSGHGMQPSRNPETGVVSRAVYRALQSGRQPAQSSVCSAQDGH